MFTEVGGVQSTVLSNELDVGSEWSIPLFLSRLASNNVSTPVSAMNPGDAPVSAALNCNWVSGRTKTVTTTIEPRSGSGGAFNPVTADFPFDETGACTLTGNGRPLVAYVQSRYVGTSINCQ
jgi:hypothetical protein